jgi:hypothetical protein
MYTGSAGWGHTDGYSESTRDSASLQDSWPRDKHDVRANSPEHNVARQIKLAEEKAHSQRRRRDE